MRPCWRWGRSLAVLAAICLVPRATPRLEAQSVGRQPPPDSTESRARGRLFDSPDPLQFTLTADFGAIVKQRATEKQSQPAGLSHVAATAGPAGCDGQS